MSASSGKHQSEVASPALEPLGWVDSKGSRWHIQASPSGIRVESDAVSFEIPRGAFGTDVYVSPMADQAVVRLSGPDDEVGFLVPRSAADELLRRIESRPPTPQQLMEREAQAAVGRRPTWPKMTGVSIGALVCASLSFVPFAGVAFAAVSIGLLVVARVRCRPSAVWLHVRWMGWVCGALLAWGLGVCVLATWTWLQPLDLARITDSLTDPRGDEYTWAVRILSIVVVIISLSVHECAHAITAWWCGDDYARSLGRVTLNPRSHIDPFGTVVLPLLLTFGGMPAFGYARPVPVLLSGVRRFRRAHILISIAGPGSNLLLAALALSVLTIVACIMRWYLPGQALINFFDPWPVVRFSGFAGAQVLAVVMSAAKLTFLINVMLAVFNLIPVPPLDGSWVLEHLFPQSLGQLYARVRPYGFLLFVVLFFSGALRPLMTPAWWIVDLAFRLLHGCLGL